MDFRAGGVEGVPEEGHDLAGIPAHAAHVMDDDVADAFLHGL